MCLNLCVTVCVCYLELLPELRGVALGVHSQHVLVGESKLTHWDGSLSTQTRLQDGIVDEDILLLEGDEGSERG